MPPWQRTIAVMDDSVVERLRAGADEAFAGRGVVFAYLFGSVALGRQRPDSDIDIAVYMGPGTTADFLPISMKLADALSSSTGLGGIEVTVLNDAPLALLGRAISERVMIYSADEPFRVRFESQAMREFLDFQFHMRSMDEQFLKDIAEGRR